LTDTLTALRPAARADAFVKRLATLATEWDRANGPEVFPADRVAAIAEAGGLSAFTDLPDAHAVRLLVRALRLVGGADLSLGRVWEGHVNAAQLVYSYGTATQRAALDHHLAAGKVLGVWNTETEPMTLEPHGASAWRLRGAKVFATAAGHLDAALITARLPDGGKQLVLVPITGMPDRVDNSRWQVRGMKGTDSGRFDFDRLVVGDDALIGAPGDYEQEPRFSAGAWRFAAVQLGATEALLRHWRDHLVQTGKGEAAIQRHRFGAGVTAVRSAGLWVAQAAARAEAGEDDAVPLVLMARGVVEEAALMVMEAAARSVGTQAFFDGSRIDRITRDLGLYLRQPVPDQARERAAAAWLEADRWGEDAWW
jgi:alkylation response protein AidB-like acyl-CoA dehydrogenase